MPTQCIIGVPATDVSSNQTTNLNPNLYLMVRYQNFLLLSLIIFFIDMRAILPLYLCTERQGVGKIESTVTYTVET
jgi:hypothetical protein